MIPSRRAREGRGTVRLFQLEALAVGAFHHGGIGLMGAHLDGVQAAVAGVLAVVGAVVYRAFNALVGRAGASAVGAVLSHEFGPPA